MSALISLSRGKTTARPCNSAKIVNKTYTKEDYDAYYKYWHDVFRRHKKYARVSKEKKRELLKEKVKEFNAQFGTSKQHPTKAFSSIGECRTVINGISYNQFLKLVDKMEIGERKDAVIAQYLAKLGLIE